MDYTEIETDFICRLSNQTSLMSEGGQFRELLIGMIKSVRAYSIDLDALEYSQRLEDIVIFLKDLRYSLNDDERMTQEQKEYYNESDVWHHKTYSGLIRKGDAVWPVRFLEFDFTVAFYLKRNYLWCESVDFVLIDAMLYVESSETKKTIIKNGTWISAKKNWWYYFYNAFRLVFWLSLLFCSFSVDKYFFLLFGFWLVYTKRIGFEQVVFGRVMTAYAELERIYALSSDRWLSVELIWQACLAGIEKGCAFDSKFWFILERLRQSRHSGVQ